MTESAAPAVPTTAATRGASPAGWVLLHIEDTIAMRHLVREILSDRPDIELVPATSGRTGLALAREHPPHLILLDLGLPDVNGLNVLDRLRAEPATCSIPVVVLTGAATPSERKRAFAGGVCEYVEKPVGVDRLLRLVERYLPSPVPGTTS